MTTESTLDAPSLSAHHAGLRRRPGFKSALRATRMALQWRLLLWWTILLLLPTIVAALPFWQLLAGSLDHSMYASRLAEHLDLVALADLAAVGKERYGAALGSGAIVALGLTLLLSPLLSGMTIAAARAPQRLGFIPLLAAGAQDYARMLRMLVWTVLPLGVAGALGGAAFHAAGQVAERAILESEAANASRLAMLAAALLFVLVHATIDAGRALLGNDRRRRSAVLAWWGGVKLLLRRPLALLGVYLVITALGLALAALLALARMHVPALGAGGTAAAFLLTQLAVVVLGWMRSARLVAMMELART